MTKEEKEIMDNIPEREQPKPERIVKLGKEFQLFDRKRVHIIKRGEYDTFNYRLLLNMEDNFQLPFSVKAYDILEPVDKGYYLLPFGPREDGYHIDPADFNIETRREKLKRLSEELQKPLDLTKNQLWLFIQTDPYELNKLGLNRDVWGREFEFPDKMLDLLKRLRITLKTPEGLFEAMPSPDYFRTGEISFLVFYPADLGPLATIESGTLENGLSLAVPSDLEKLAQIRARFVMADEKPDENPNNQAPNTK